MKRIFPLALLILLLLTVAACSGGGAGANPGGGTTEPQRTTAEPGAAASVQTESQQGDVLSGEKPVLRQLQPYDRFDPSTDRTAIFLEEKTGYKSIYEMLPEELPNEKLNLLMANQEKYDIMRLTRDQFFRLAETGALQPLNELLDQYGQNLLAGIEDEAWKAATIDGQIYAIPQTGTGDSVGASLVVRKDWLDELGLEVPKTRDELYSVMKALKQQKDVIPLVWHGGILAEIASTFGIYNTWDVIDGELYHSAEHPRLKEYLQFMNQLYTEGLIDSEWPINTGSIAIEKFTSGKAGMMKLAWWSAPAVVSALERNFPDAELATIPFLPDENGKAGIGIHTGITYFIAIPKWADHKEHAMNYMNMKLEEDLFKELVIGQEGVHHRVEDGKYFPILPAFDELNNGSYFLTGVDGRVYPDYWQARVRKDPILFHYYEELQDLADGLFIEDPMSNAPPIQSISEHIQKLAKFSEDTFLRYIAGAESIDNFDSFLSQWRADGGEQMVKDAREWYHSHQE